MSSRKLASLALCLVLTSAAFAQTKPYGEVVTKESVSQEGLFGVHRKGDQILFEIPKEGFGKEMLWQTEIAKLPQNIRAGWPGTPIGTRVVRFVRRGDKVYLRDVQYMLRTASEGAVRKGIEANSFEPIIMAFDVMAEGKDGSAVIDVTKLYTTDPQDFSIREPFPGASIDAGRSYVEKVKAFPRNIETASVLTVNFPRPQPAGVFGEGSPTSQMTVMVRYSLLQLPDKPMQGRVGDSRIGYFVQRFLEFGRTDNVGKHREYINRFRLEKRDPSAELSEPLQPITFYLAREVPEKFRPAIKRGIEAWNLAFAQAGFKNAIVAKDAPTLKEDPDWDEEDARYSVIRWAPSMDMNAFGPSIQDPRSGETLSAHIVIWNNVTDLVQRWYFMQAGAVDPKAQKLPFGDELMSQLVEYVVSHEVGHTLGLAHNFKASNWYTPAQLRNPKFVAEHGLSASIMDYSRFNYVAQPGDGVTTFLGGIGPYDKMAIEYGYKPMSLRSPEDEKPALNAILRRQVTDPRLRFGGGRVPFDPSTLSEDVGGGDRVEASRLAMLNLDRIARDVLLPAVTKPGEDYFDLALNWIEMLGQRQRYLDHVTMLLGGVEETEYHAGDAGDNYKPVPAATQRRAAQFLLTTGLSKPDALLDGKVWNKICTTGDVGLVVGMQRTVLANMLESYRLRRIVDAHARYGKAAYAPQEHVDAIHNAVWKELAIPALGVNVYRRGLQNSYLELVATKLNRPVMEIPADFQLMLKDSLRKAVRQIDAKIPQTKDRLTVLHLRETRSKIERILTNRGGEAGVASAPGNPVAAHHLHDCFTATKYLPPFVADVLKEEYRTRLAKPLE
jgi:ribosomal protein S18 acetylase RimI-like enzyme